MSHRVEAKARARAAREDAERRERAQAVRRKRVRRLLAVAVVAVAAAGGAVVTAGGGEGAGGDRVKGVAEAGEMLAGIPQQGTRLGDPRAPLVLTEYADLQCPFCRQFAVEALPQIVERYVRPGKVQLDLKLLRFLGEDSVRGAHAALAAGTKDRLWNFVDLFYRNQGAENTGYADDGFLRGIGTAAGVPSVLQAVEASAHEPQLAAAEADAAARGISSTPTFTLGRRDGDQQLLKLSGTDFAAFENVIEPQLKR